MVDEYNTGNPVPSSAMPDAWDNNATIDKFVNSTEMIVVTRTGVERDTMAGMQKKADDQRDQMAADGAAVVEETRQNLIPLSKQYMTLAEAQADIANIPEGSTTYYRSPDDSALAVEVINNAGTLQPTGRKMPSQQAVGDIAEQTRQALDWLQRVYLGQQSQAAAISDTTDKSNANEIALQRLYLGQQSQGTAISDTADKTDDIEEQIQQALDWLQRVYLGQQSQAAAISDTTDKSNANEIALQRLYLGQQSQGTAISDTADKTDDIEEQIQQALDWLQRVYLGQQSQAAAISDTTDKSNANEIALQRLYLGQQSQAETQSQITNDNKSTITALQHVSLSLQVISEIIFSQERALNVGQNNISDINTAVHVLSETLTSLGVADSQIRSTIHSLSTSLQIVIDAINLAPTTKDLDGARLQSLLNLSLLASELYKLDGLDTGGVGSAGATEVTDGIYAFPTPERIVRIDITSPQGVPASKADGKYQGKCKIDIDGVSLTAFSTIAVQGSSSAGYPKKNLTIAFYFDDAYSTDLNLKIGDGLAFSEWVYKANYIDSTHSRNLIGYTLWTQMQNTRDIWPRREVDHYYVGKTGLAAVDTGATGIPKGYPCIVYINSEFYGIGGIMVGKKRANYNIAKNIPEQIYLEFQNCDIRTLDITNPDICEVTAPSSVTATVNGYLDVWRTFAQLPQSDFSEALPEHMDKMNTSDYYILMMFLCAVDCFNKNMLFMTWDAQKWFCMPYDLDTTFGLNSSGQAIAYEPTLNPITEGFALSGNREFWGKVYTAIGSDINARYAQLRNSGVLSVGNVSRIMTDLQSKYTIDMFERELGKWTGLPSKDITSNDQLLSWLTQRMVWLDQYFSYE